MNVRWKGVKGYVAIAVIAVCFSLGSEGHQGQPEVPGAKQTERPIAAGGGEVGDLLRQWYARGTAAGNSGDYYDNRDNGHSQLKIDPYPQLQKLEYTEEEIRARRNYGMQHKIVPNVVFGNSSTSAPPHQAGSNVRNYYCDPQGLQFLFAQYARSNLYIYPEHRDHDPGHNGLGGYGDLFPTNTPYVIVSQGSSGSDQPFMRMLPYVLAAFRPGVKSKLIDSGLLMPTIQMIMRMNANNLKNPEEYLSVKAHPTVFEGRFIDTKKMIEMAHEIKLSSLPPAVVLNVVGEETPVKGIDYFDPELTEQLGDTPAVIARIFRGSKYSRSMTVSAEQSFDVNRRPLKFYWVVLRGDPAGIQIDYLNDARSVARIKVTYFERYPVWEGSSLESNRIDIGVFVHNGVYYSPPAFITFYTLDSEIRTYRTDRQPLEIAYDAGTAEISIADWSELFRALDATSTSWRDRFLKRQFTPRELAALAGVSGEFRTIHADRLAAEEKQKMAADERKKANDLVKKLKEELAAAEINHSFRDNPESRAALDSAAETLADALERHDKTTAEASSATRALNNIKAIEKKILERNLPGLDVGTGALVQHAMDLLLQDPNVWITNEKELMDLYQSADKKAREDFDSARNLLVAFHVADTSGHTSFRLKPVLRGKSPMSDRLTGYEKSMIERLNGVLLSGIVFPRIVRSDWRENFVDYRLTSSKRWRDIYRYAPDGTPMGWRRIQRDNVSDFNAEGLLVLEKDSLGRCTKGRVVRYELEPHKRDGSGRIAGYYRREVRIMPTEVLREYEYDGKVDWKGHIKLR